MNNNAGQWTQIAAFGPWTLLRGIPEPGEKAQFAAEAIDNALTAYVSPEHPLPEAHQAQQARNMRKMIGLYVPSVADVSLSQETIYALCDMMSENQLLNASVAAGMRSAAQQAALQTAAFQTYQTYMSAVEALEKAQQAYPDIARCEHSLATAFDIRLEGKLDWTVSDPMARNADGQWLLDNAWRFGFIRRYPPDNAICAGRIGEEGHWRYVGRAHAAVIRVTGWCLEEYLEALRKEQALMLTFDGQCAALILSAPLEAGSASFSVPDGASLTVSRDNLGRAVCACIPKDSVLTLSPTELISSDPASRAGV